MKLLLCGGGSGEKTILANQVFNEIIENSKPILYVPLARPADGYDDCLKWVRNELNSVEFPEIIMVKSASELASKNLSDYSGIFIGGGNTYKLLKELKETKAFDNFKEFIANNGVVYGCSAGSVIFGKNIDSISYMDSNDIALKDTFGANSIFGMSITAHYTNKNEEKTELATNFLIEYTKNNEPVIALPEEDTLFINGNAVKIIGTRPYYVFHSGTKTGYQPNIEYTADEFSKLAA